MSVQGMIEKNVGSVPGAAVPADAAGYTSVHAWWAVGIFSLAAMLSYTDRQVLSLLVDPIRKDLLLTDGDLGLLQGAVFAVAYSLASLPIGMLADRYSRRRIIGAGVLLWSLATIACAFAHTFGELAAARMAVAIGEASLGPAAVSMISDFFPPARRGLALSTLQSGFTMGSGAAVIVGGLALTAANAGAFAHLPFLAGLPPWKAVFVVVGVPGFLFVALISMIKEPRRQSNDSNNLDSGSIREIIPQMRRLRSVLVPMYFSVGAVTVGDFAVGAWAPTVLSRQFGFSPSEIATRWGITSIAVALSGTVIGGALSDYCYRRGGLRARLRFAAAAFFLGILSGIAIFGFNHAAIAFMGFASWVFLAAVAGMGTIAALQDVLPSEMRAFGMAIYAFTAIIVGMTLGPSLVAFSSSRLFEGPSSVASGIGTVVMLAGALAGIGFYKASNAR
jgi:MFS family permease